MAAVQQSQPAQTAQATNNGPALTEDGNEPPSLAASDLQALLANVSSVDAAAQRSTAAVAGQSNQPPVMQGPAPGAENLTALMGDGVLKQRPATATDDGRANAALLQSTLTANSQSPVLGTALSDDARLALQRALAANSGTHKTGSDGVIRAQSLGDAAAIALPNGMRPTVLQSLLPEVTNLKAGSHRPDQAVDTLLPLRGSELLGSGTTVSTDDLNGTTAMAAGQRLSTLSSSAVPQLPVATPVGQPGWGSEIGQRVMMMAKGDLREAQLQLHPRSLGPVEVRIVYGHDHQLNVSFTAANPVARDALDAALPRLREMFDQQGLNLANTDISHESFAQQEQRQHAEAHSLAANEAVNGGYDIQVDSGPPPPTVISDGLLDAYA
jgi:flagellar hook-length control protein FliK